MPRNRKKMIRARMEKTGESYQVAARNVRANGAVEAASPPRSARFFADPTSIASRALERRLREVWPGLRVDLVAGGIFPADAPQPRRYRSHQLCAHIPRPIATQEIHIEVRTGERRGDSSEFRVWGWIDGNDHYVDRRVDLLSESDLGAFLGEIMELIRRHVPNCWPPELSQHATMLRSPVIDEVNTRDDLEADDAIAALRLYWPVGQMVVDACHEWDMCQGSVMSYEELCMRLSQTRAALDAAAERLPAGLTARFGCGREIVSAHVEYVQGQRAYLAKVTEWLNGASDDLRTALARQPLCEVCWDAHSTAGSFPMDETNGYGRVMAIESTKRLFQCDAWDNVAWVNKVAARVGLGPDKAGGVLRVRSSQRILNY